MEKFNHWIIEKLAIDGYVIWVFPVVILLGLAVVGCGNPDYKPVPRENVIGVAEYQVFKVDEMTCIKFGTGNHFEITCNWDEWKGR